MSDPLSTIASAAGIISLGLEVLDRMIVYCDAFRAYNQDAEDLGHKATGLSRTLKHLDDVLQQRHAVEPSSRQQIVDLLEASNVTLEKLQEMTRKIPIPPKSSKTRDLAQRALYPLRRQALMDAARLLDTLQGNIDTALGVLLLHQGSVAQHTLRHDVQAQNMLLQQRLDEQDTQLERMVRIQSCSSHREAVTHIKQESMIRYMLDSKLPVAPSLLYTMQSENSRAAAAMSAIDSHSTTHVRRQMPSGKVTHHAPQSVTALQRKHTEVLKRKIHLHSGILRFSLSLSLSITQRAGGYSIGHTLTYRAITPYDFDELMNRYRENPVNHANSDLSCCRYLFESGVIKPSDKSRDGITMLDVLLIKDLGFSFLFPNSWNPHAFLEVMDYFLKFTAPLEDNSGLEGTYLNHFVSNAQPKESSYPLIARLVDAGSYITDFALTPFNRHVIRHIIFNHAEAVLLSAEARAIACEDEIALANLISRGQLLANDIIGEWKAIGLVLGWPSGVSLLLETATRPLPGDCISWAAQLNCLSSVELLLDAGAPLYTFHLSEGSRSRNPRIIDLLVDEFIARREHLRDFAMRYLPESRWRSLGVSSSCLPHLNAPMVYNALRKQGISVADKLDPRKQSLHCWGQGSEIVYEEYVGNVLFEAGLSISHLNKLYDAGVVDVDSPDESGFVSLKGGYRVHPLQDILSRARWMISKGANPSNRLPGATIPAFHTIFHESMYQLERAASRKDSIAEAMKFIDDEFAMLDEENRNFLIAIIMEDRFSGRQCACSKAGWTPFASWVRKPRHHLNELATVAIRQTMLNVLRLMPACSGTAGAVIRLFTFEDLDLEHICPGESGDCQLDDAEREVVQGIQEEGLQQLEELTERSAEQFQGLHVPLVRFMQECWCVQMQEYLQRDRQLSPDELNRIRDLGVVDLAPAAVPLNGDEWCVVLHPKVTEDVKS
ncbi:uncharacterized protein ACLA_006800 [Aspergillus clavatus NRRL 1]|uniref:Fungal N-terminal domain-containing protein n=1 Tax=Aspergillus clavatus (strain ATCC 1007 / CBS 513.65 / DSM 816 / NCTC 3887 / NRRL 1 / QM 1276 / 107) TaxID=344612 RepID=A1CDJ5_ASPCL|nr:uncharacterized protein ACLA_006800 [Aspergillus clavatus NRRL 1]EAW11922.1 hypothetical protein ACLA_006800 [Aspergillus clavatus NRRL 1]